MTGSEALGLLKSGKKIRRKVWPSDCSFSVKLIDVKSYQFNVFGNYEFMSLIQKNSTFVIESLMYDDWEIAE